MEPSKSNIVEHTIIAYKNYLYFKNKEDNLDNSNKLYTAKFKGMVDMGMGLMNETEREEFHEKIKKYDN